MCVASPTLTSRYIVNPVGALDIEGDHRLCFSKRQIATRISDLWQFYDFNL